MLLNVNNKPQRIVQKANILWFLSCPRLSETFLQFRGCAIEVYWGELYWLIDIVGKILQIYFKAFVLHYILFILLLLISTKTQCLVNIKGLLCLQTVECHSAFSKSEKNLGKLIYRRYSKNEIFQKPPFLSTHCSSNFKGAHIRVKLVLTITSHHQLCFPELFWRLLLKKSQ